MVHYTILDCQDLDGPTGDSWVQFGRGTRKKKKINCKKDKLEREIKEIDIRFLIAWPPSHPRAAFYIERRRPSITD